MVNFFLLGLREFSINVQKIIHKMFIISCIKKVVKKEFFVLKTTYFKIKILFLLVII